MDDLYTPIHDGMRISLDDLSLNDTTSDIEEDILNVRRSAESVLEWKRGTEQNVNRCFVRQKRAALLTFEFWSSGADRFMENFCWSSCADAEFSRHRSQSFDYYLGGLLICRLVFGQFSCIYSCGDVSSFVTGLGLVEIETRFLSTAIPEGKKCPCETIVRYLTS